MHLLMRSIFNLRTLRGNERKRVALVLDAATGVAGAEYVRLLRPWQSWVTIEGVVTIASPVKPGVLETLVSPTNSAVVIVSEREDILQSVRHECKRLNVPCIDSAYPATSDRTSWLCQEVAHHDFEIGGVNEWDGQPTQYAQYILQYLSATQCEKIFPKYVLPYLEQFLQEQNGEPVDTLDLGCGPISVLRWGALRGLMTITGVDPLLDMYQIILERHGLSGLPNIFCQRAFCISAEELSLHVAPASYRFAFSRNAVDHVEDPQLLIRQVAACLRPGGIFALEFNTREGSRENWAQLHKFDLYLDSAGTLMCASQDGSSHPLVPEDTGVVLREVVVSTETYTIVVLERRMEGEQLESLWQRTKEWRHETQVPRPRKTQLVTRAYKGFKQLAKPLYRWAKPRG